MVHVVVSHKVEDYEKWKKVFDEDSSNRKVGGSQGGVLYRRTDDNTIISGAFEWDTLENAQKYFHSDEIKKKMSEAGVIGKPTIIFEEKIETITD